MTIENGATLTIQGVNDLGTEDANLILRKLEGMDDKIDAMQEQRYTNGLAAKEVEGRVTATESYIEDHKDWHKDDAKHKRALNWKLWFVIIGGIASLAIALLNSRIV